MNDKAVITEKLTRRFGSFIAVNEIDLTVDKGEIFGFLGANGAGKTTMIKMLCGLLMPSSGKATVAGYDIYKENEKIKKSIGYMSQKFSLYNDLTIQENIDFYGGIYGLSKLEIKRKKEEIAEKLQLGEIMTRLTGEIPVGFKQKLALACSMLHDPSLIFLDEPTSGVDPKVRRDFWSVINNLAKEGKTIFVTTHFMDEAEYCHRISIMHQGVIIALDNPHEMKKKHGLNSIQDIFISLIKGRING